MKMEERKILFIPVKDYAYKLGKTEKTIYNWIDNGTIPKHRTKKIMGATFIQKE